MTGSSNDGVARRGQPGRRPRPAFRNRDAFAGCDYEPSPTTFCGRGPTSCKVRSAATTRKIGTRSGSSGRRSRVRRGVRAAWGKWCKAASRAADVLPHGLTTAKLPAASRGPTVSAPARRRRDRKMRN